MKNKINGVLPALIATLAIVSGSAKAEINDSPYYNLFDATINTSTGTVTGDGLEVRLCGTGFCDAGQQNEGWAIFRALDRNVSRGSGNIDPFLRFTDNESLSGVAPGNNEWEVAYNTNYTSTTNPANPGLVELHANDIINDPTNPDIIVNQAKDTNAGNPDFNRALLFSDLLETKDADGFFHFVLDINENNADDFRMIRLEELAFFADESDQMAYFTQDKDGTTGGNLASSTLCTDDTGADCAEKIWDMDWNGESPGGVGAQKNGDAIGGIVLDNLQNGGGGSGDFDMELLLHEDLFAGVGEDEFIYLANFMGETGGTNQEAGADFEEWALEKCIVDCGNGDTGVPEPTSLLLIGATIPGLVGLRRRRKSPRD